MKTICTYLFFALSTAATCAQVSQHQVFAVRVMDAAKPHQPLEKVYLTVVSDGDRFEDMDATDSAGNCLLRLDSPSRQKHYTLRMEKRGYHFSAMRYRPAKDSVFFLKKDGQIYPNTLLAQDNCSITEYGDYEPKPIHNWKDLPAPIQQKLKEHLLLKVGPDLFPKLSVTGGQLVDIDRMHTVDPDTRNYRWTPYPYNVCVSYSDTAAGIGSYSAEVVLNEEGNIVEEFLFPKTKSGKALYIPLDSVLKILQHQGHNRESLAHVYFKYNQSEDHFYWSLAYKLPCGFGKYMYDWVEISSEGTVKEKSRQYSILLEDPKPAPFVGGTLQKSPPYPTEWLALSSVKLESEDYELFLQDGTPYTGQALSGDWDVQIYSYQNGRRIAYEQWLPQDGHWVLNTREEYDTISLIFTKRWFYENGQLKNIGTYKSTVMAFAMPLEPVDGDFRWYYPNGQLKKEISMQNHTLNGFCRRYAENGTPEEELHFTDGRPYGHWKQYNAEGKLSGELFFNADGLYRGYWKEGETCYEKSMWKPEIRVSCP